MFRLFFIFFSSDFGGPECCYNVKIHLWGWRCCYSIALNPLISSSLIQKVHLLSLCTVLFSKTKNFISVLKNLPCLVVPYFPFTSINLWLWLLLLLSNCPQTESGDRTSWSLPTTLLFFLSSFPFFFSHVNCFL